jgi:glycosyltransferase involved in cell wall biosynthesis
MRALWERPFDEINGLPAVARPAAHALFSRLRVWDVAAANRVDRFVANSRTTQQRIATHYRRESVLLNPPIDTERFTPAAQTPGDYYLIASRPVPYKRIDVAVAAAAQLGRRVVLVGGGDLPAGMPGRERVEVRGHVDDATLMDLMRGARALLFPQLEDFGMTPLEMNACGRPVVAYRAGGALETVVPDVTGVFAAEQTPASFAAAMLRLESLQLDPAEIRRHAERFSRAHFIDGLQQIVTDAVAELRA